MKCKRASDHEWDYGQTPNGTKTKTCKKCNLTMYYTSKPVGTPYRWRINPF